MNERQLFGIPLILIAAMGWAGEVLAQDATGGGTNPINMPAWRDGKSGESARRARIPWSDTEKYQDCGLACLYEKGNENLSLQSLYLIDKINELVSIDASTAGGRQRIREILGVFCSGGGDPAECRGRYLRTQTRNLRQIASAMERNADSAAKFKNGKGFDLRGSMPVFAILRGEGDEKPRKPQTPHVPTLTELRAQYERDTSDLQNLISADYEKWVASQEHPPSRDEFVKTRIVDRDPENPNSGKMTIIETDATGAPKIDEKAYAEARARWQRSSFRESDLREFRSFRAQFKDGLDYRQQMLRSLEHNRDIFNSSRKEVVDGANRAIAKAGLKSVSTVTYPGRGVAGSGSQDYTTVQQIESDRGQRSGLAGVVTGEERVNEALPRKDQTNFVTIVLPPETIRRTAAELEKALIP